MSHAHAHGARRGDDRRALVLALGLIAVFMVVEAVAGYLAGSLALLADAGHMLGDVGSLGLALGAAWLAARPPTAERTFGFQRAEILAALANGVALVAIAIWIFVEALQRLRDPHEPAGGWMLAVGAVGLVVNLAAAFVLSRNDRRGLHVQSALRHVFADALGSVGVIAGAAVVLTTGSTRADPLIALAIGVLVLLSSWTILRDSVAVLLEAAPRGLDPGEVGRAMLGIDGVQEVHDLHVWTITSGFPSLSAHVLVAPGDDCHGARRRLEALLGERFGLTHTTLQVDHAEPGPRAVELGTVYRRETPL